MSKVYSPDGELLFPTDFSTEQELLNALKEHNVIKSTLDLVIEEGPDGLLFITDGINEVATVE